MTYRLVIARSAVSALSQDLPETVAAAAMGLINGPLLEHPQRLGKRLHEPLDGKWSACRGQYRIIYTIDTAHQIVTVLRVSHRRDAYR